MCNPTTEEVKLKMLSDSGAFRQDLYNHAKMSHPGQLHNVVIYMRAEAKHDSRSGGCEFDLPNPPFLPDLILHARHIRACFELPRA